MKKSLFLGVSLAITATVQAVPVVATSSQTNGTNSLPHTYVPSTTDLIGGLAPSAQVGNFVQEGAGGTPVLTNGLFPTPITRDGGGPFQFSAFATGGNGGGTSLTYTLVLASDIALIDVFGGWQDGGRDQQSYSILYSTVLAPATFLALATVNFNPPDPAGFPQVTRVTISDTTGTLAANVAAIRFDFNATENGYSGTPKSTWWPPRSRARSLCSASARWAQRLGDDAHRIASSPAHAPKRSPSRLGTVTPSFL